MDKEKVIKEIKDGIAFAESRGFGGLANTMRDALALLKEQKPETGCWVHGHCSFCGEDIGSKLDTWTNIQHFLFCPKCGAKMEGR